MKKIQASANVYKTPRFFWMITMSDGGLLFEEPDAQPIYLDPDAEDELLGSSLRQTLSKSQTVSMEEFHEILKSGIVQKRGKDRDVWIMKTSGYKTKRAMYQSMDFCLVIVSGDEIKIKPTDRNSFHGRQGISNEIYVSVSVSDTELGAALRDGFSRCTSSYQARRERDHRQ